MFGSPTKYAGKETVTKQVKVYNQNAAQREIYIKPDAKTGIGGMTMVQNEAQYKTVEEVVRVPCPKCVRFYCPKKGCCGTTSDSVIKMATAQGPVGSPHIGLIPTMKKIAE